MSDFLIIMAMNGFVICINQGNNFGIDLLVTKVRLLFVISYIAEKLNVTMYMVILVLLNFLSRL